MRADGVFIVFSVCSAILVCKTDFDCSFWPSLAVMDVCAVIVLVVFVRLVADNLCSSELDRLLLEIGCNCRDENIKEDVIRLRLIIYTTVLSEIPTLIFRKYKFKLMMSKLMLIIKFISPDNHKNHINAMKMINNYIFSKRVTCIFNGIMYYFTFVILRSISVS